MLFFKKNDWITVEQYNYNYLSNFGNKVTFFNIQYSKIRNKFRLKIEGNEYCNFQYELLIKAENKVVELNKSLLLGEDINTLLSK